MEDKRLKSLLQASSDPYIYHVLFQVAKRADQRDKELNKKVLVGVWGDQRKIHWISWEKLCQPKNEDGMGFKELSKFNDSLLAKQIWRLENNEECIFHRVFKAKVFPHYSVLDCEVFNKDSFAWKSII